MSKKFDRILAEIDNRVQEQPGTTELMLVYSQYEEVLKQCNNYLSELLPKSSITTSNNSFE